MNMDQIDNINRLAAGAESIVSALIALYGNGDDHVVLPDGVLCDLFLQVSTNLRDIKSVANQVWEASQEAKR